MKKRLSFGCAAAMLFAVAAAHAEDSPKPLDVHWNEGAEDCAAHPPPPLQVHRYDARTFILRESLCATAEAPFLYLLVGANRALLIDSGDVAAAKDMPLARTVRSLLSDNGASPPPLLIVHTHGHLDHRSGDVQFEGQADAEIVATDLAHVTQKFGFTDWPQGQAGIDLGGRVVDVLPTPGHYPSHLSFYDRTTGLLFTGDFLMPGRLLIDDAAQDLASANRLADFARSHPITHVLGGHIEMQASGETYMPGVSYHPDEHRLELMQRDALALPDVVRSFNGLYSRHGIFVMVSQTRMLIVIGTLAIGVLVLIGAMLTRFLRRRRARRLR